MKLERSRTDSVLFGLCGGLARSTGIEASLIRIALVVGGFLTGGTLFFLYIAACLFIPKEAALHAYANWHTVSPGYAGYAGSYGFPGSVFSAGAAPAIPPVPAPTVDAMLNKLEQHALNREIESLRAKLAQYEQSR